MIDPRLSNLALEVAEGSGFERFFQNFYPEFAGVAFTPLGGNQDGGADAFDTPVHEGQGTITQRDRRARGDRGRLCQPIAAARIPIPEDRGGHRLWAAVAAPLCQRVDDAPRPACQLGGSTPAARGRLIYYAPKPSCEFPH
jgi:hypothetical protein